VNGTGGAVSGSTSYKSVAVAEKLTTWKWRLGSDRMYDWNTKCQNVYVHVRVRGMIDT
jgi:hypothetical protein